MNLNINIVHCKLNNDIVNLPITVKDHIINHNLISSKLINNDINKYPPTKNIVNFYLLISIIQLLSIKEDGDLYYLIDNNTDSTIKQIKTVFNTINLLVDNKFNLNFDTINN